MPDFPVFNKCNNHCLMCSNPEGLWKKDSNLFKLNKLLKRIERFRKGQEEFLNNYSDAFSLTGGEPTLNPNLIPLIKKINEYFPNIRISCLTNGRLFAYSDYAREFLKSEANLELILSIHAHTADIHDRITRVPGSFSQTIKGLQNIFRFKKMNHIVEIRVVLHRLNYIFLIEITKFIKKRFPYINRIVFIFFEIEGHAYKNFSKLRLTYSKLYPYLVKINNILPYFAEVRFYHFPLCTLPEDYFPYAWRTLPSFEVSFPMVCKRCGLKELCLGVHKSYLEYIGASEFKPINSNELMLIRNEDWHNPIRQTKRVGHARQRDI